MNSSQELIERIFEGFDELFTPLFNAVEGESPRAKIILYAAQIDEYLKLVLQKLLKKHRSKKEKDDELFRVYGPLSTFSARIAMAYRLGLISRDDADAFDVLRNLRNDCAHLIYEFCLSTSPTREHISRFVDLTCNDPSRFFMFYVGGPNVPCPKTNEDALTYCCIFHILYLKHTLEVMSVSELHHTEDLLNIRTKYPEMLPDSKIHWSPLEPRA